MTVELLRVVTVGHVDHGKSTLVGRLLHETGNLPAGRYEQVEQLCRTQGKPFEYAFLLDALEEERDQGVTIDAAQVWLDLDGLRVTFIDAPGHHEFVKNMVCGAAVADAAILMIDAEEGVRQQTRRHAHLLRFLGVDQMVVVVNKMDLVDWSHERFSEIENEVREYLGRVGLTAVTCVPTSARQGDNVTERSRRMPWYSGATFLDTLRKLRRSPAPEHHPLRFAVQDVYKFDKRRIVAGRVESGTVRAGDTVLCSPSDKRAVVRSIERWSSHNPSRVASAGESVGLTFMDQIFIERGEVISHAHRAPIVSDVFRARVFWLGRRPLVPGRSYQLRLLTAEQSCEIEEIVNVLDAATLDALPGNGGVPRNEVGEVILRLRQPIALDAHEELPRSGRFVLVDNHVVCGGGTVAPLEYPDQRAALHPSVTSRNIVWDTGQVTAADRAKLAGHGGAVIWLTGLSGAGKSTISDLLEAHLYADGVRTYRLDGDNVRHGLNRDLGFEPDDRAENIRRIAEVANLLADAGVVVITSFISPFRADRRHAREIVQSGPFIEVFVDCPIEECERRDPKGLYRRARAGEIAHFTGVSSPYEAPQDPEVTIRSSGVSPEEAVTSLRERLRELGIIPKRA